MPTAQQDIRTVIDHHDAMTKPARHDDTLVISGGWLDPEPGEMRMPCGDSIPEADETTHQRECSVCARELALAGEVAW